MSTGINRVFLFGNLGADPELRTVSGGQSVMKFSLATTTNWFDKDGNKKENTAWLRITVWGKRGEALSKILHKGDRVFVDGRIETSSYEKEGRKVYSTDVIANDIVLGGGRRPVGDSMPTRQAGVPVLVEEEELPF